ncbi:MAG TPA: rhodanese-like domain-containing protein [Oligoflexus sp.]|uniref:rhodanese-like domain-containing protein n=1 Tax=Oligoflexus sp. TaxID=1971216 RepID=UPI002D33F51C|nr:rhodanese-like domain-containing protein [Oligoflexus sp.]HYX34375.1 rhodanese-like domain-containing protein [Oligoflexus sp.]
MSMLSAFVLASSMLVSGFGFAQEHKVFCSAVPGWAIGEEVPAAQEYSVLTHELLDAKKAAEIVKNEKVAFIDSRSDEDVKGGTIPRTIHIVSDSKDPAKHQFSNEKFLVEKLNKKLNTQFSKVSDFKDYKVVLFCNGKKCHRSTFAACTLRDLGFPKDNIYLMLGGFGEWKAAGLPVK